jgi:branched-chain amino acid transport system substrate-binding protein
MTQDSITAYGDMWILKEALERVGEADPVKVAQEIHNMQLTEGPAASAFPGLVAFGKDGRRTGAQLVIVQWQDRVPVSVYPTDQALGTPRWPKQ